MILLNAKWLVLPLAVWVTLFHSAWAQKEPGLSKGEKSEFGKLQDVAKSRTATSSGLIITWSETNDELRGFSIQLGTWSSLKVEPQERVEAFVAGDVAAVETSDSLVAYSAVKGFWDVIPKRQGNKAQANLTNELVTFRDGEHLYTFSASHGAWTSPTAPDLSPCQGMLKVEDLKASLHHFNRWKATLPAHKARGINCATVDLSNELVVTASRKSYLDDALAQLKPLRAESKGKTPLLDPNIDYGAQLGDRIVGLKRRASRLERESLQLGERLAGNLTLDNADRKMLEKLVGDSFDARHQLQNYEMMYMEKQLDQVRKNLSDRRRGREAIVARRVSELLNANNQATAWQTTPGELGSTTEQDVLSPGPGVIANPLKTPSDLEDIGGQTSSRTPNAPAAALSPDALSPDALSPDALRSLGRYQDADNVLRIMHGSQPMRLPSEYVELLRNSRKNLVVFEKQRNAAVKRREADKILGDEVAAQRNETGLKVYDKSVDSAKRDWDRNWNEYKMQLKLLQLDIGEAEEAVAVSASQLREKEQAVKAGLAPGSHVDGERLKLVVSKNRLESVQARYRLYADIEASEPSLSPASYRAEEEGFSSDAGK